MNHEYIDLYTTAFWLFVFVSLVVLTPITNSVYCKWTWAAINVWFLYQLMGAKSVVVVVGVLFVWGLLLLMTHLATSRLQPNGQFTRTGQLDAPHPADRFVSCNLVNQRLTRRPIKIQNANRFATR